ncbi:MAG: ABC transporter ATP-binding protein [Lachnospiraceae bacterium]|nr:ABC transporter ATP-binding protein [Lachnospiraceae bacterium]
MMKIKNIQKSFGKKQVLKGCSFDGNPGECIGIVGINGSGKSTLLSIIAGIRKPDDGDVQINDRNILKNPKYTSEYIGYVPQENPVFPDLTVKDNLMLWYCDSKTTFEDAANRGVIAMLGLTPILKQKVKTLSGGMKKRLSIAMSVANNPPIIILDEPSAALDLPTKLAIRDYLKSYATAGGTVIIATHDEEELSICDKLYVMRDGTLAQVSKELRGDELLTAMDINKEVKNV